MQRLVTGSLIYTSPLTYCTMCDSKFSAAATVIEGVHELPSCKDALLAASFCACFQGIYINSETTKTK